MSSVTFSTTVGGDGSTVTDDANATTGLDGGGHRTRFVPALAQVVAVAANTVTVAGQAAGSLSQAQGAANASAASATTAAGSATAAATSATSAASAASTAANQAAAATTTAITTAMTGYVTAASTSATAAASSATASAASATAAADSAAQAAASANVGAATETAPGLIEIATQVETDTGTDATRAIPPKYLKGNIDARLAAAQRNLSVDTGSLSTAAVATNTVTSDQIVLNKTAAALYRSPNTVTAMYLYDTTLDTDGGAWTDKQSHTSWHNEALSGAWLGPISGLQSATHREANGWEMIHVRPVPGVGTVHQGTAGAYVRREVAAGENITGDIDIRVKVSLLDWTPASLSTIAAAFQNLSGGNLWRFSVTNSGTLRFGTYTTTAVDTDSSVATGITDGATKWVRVTSRVSDGQTIFYTGDDGIVWTQLGTTLTHGQLGPRTQLNCPYYELGSYGVGASNQASGTFYRAEFRRGIDGTVVVKFDGSAITANNIGDYYQSSADGKFYQVPENFVPNNQMVGAVVGIIGSGGALPANWNSASGGAGLQKEVTAVGTDSSGRKYVDYRISGTPTDSAHYPVVTGSLNVPARNGEVVTRSVILSSSSTGVTVKTFNEIYSAGGTFLTSSTGSALSVTASNAKFSETTTIAHATAATTGFVLKLEYTSGVALDYTLRITEPEIVRSALPGSGQARSTTSGTQLQTYRGNKAAFPKLVGIVAEGNSVALYDMSDRSMWMHFVGGANAHIFSSGIGAISALQGSLFVGHTASAGMAEVSFTKDSARLFRASRYDHLKNVANRNDNTGVTNYVLSSLSSIAGAAVNAVAAYVLPNAPIDAATGLPIPTIAVGTTVGLSIVKSDNTVQNHTATNTVNVGFNRRGDVWFQMGENAKNFRKSLAPTYAANVTVADGTVGGSGTPFASTSVSRPFSVNSALIRDTGSVGVYQYHPNDVSATASGVLSHIGPYHNTGHMIGDVRRTIIAEAAQGYTYGSDLVTGDSSSFAGGVGSWVTSPSYASTTLVSGGEMTVTATANFGRQVISIATEVGVTYQASVYARKISGASNSAAMLAYANVNTGVTSASLAYGAVSEKITLDFTATATTTWLLLGENNAVSGGVHGFKNFRVRKVDLLGSTIDRVPNLNNLIVNGDFTGTNAGWTTGNANSTVTNTGTALQVQVVATGVGAGVYQDFNTVPGLTYEVSYDVVTNTTGTTIFTFVGSANNFTSSTLVNVGMSGTGTARQRFTATGATHGLSIGSNTSALTASTFSIDNVVLKEVALDRTYKAKPSTIYGALTRSNVASAASLVCYGGFSGANYLQEAYSSDLDFGTGTWSVGAWVNIPAALSGGTLSGATWTETTGTELWNNSTATVAGESTQVSSGVYRIYSSAGASSTVQVPNSAAVGKMYRLSFTIDSVTAIGTGVGNTGYMPNGFSYGFTVNPGTYTQYVPATSTVVSIGRVAASGVTDIQISNVSLKEVTPLMLVDRSAATGPRIRLGIGANGGFYAEANDGTTQRIAFTTQAYNSDAWVNIRAQYTVDGKLAIVVNGETLASTTGTPLLTLSNALATFTTGNSYLGSSPVIGKLTLVKWSASVPTAEQSRWMYAQELQMFRSGAQVAFPVYGNLNGFSYDSDTDRWHVAQASYASEWSGLVRVASTAVPYGSYTLVQSQSNARIAYRSSSITGVDVDRPARSLRAELNTKRNGSALKSRLPFDFDAVSFTGTTTNASNQVTGVTAVVGTPVAGMAISGTGIAVGTTIVSISGTTYTLSANATASGTVTISQTDFALPVGFTAMDVRLNGALQREGSTKSYVRYFDGFVEYVRLNTAPGTNAWLQVIAER